VEPSPHTALVDLLGGQVQVVFASMSSLIEYVRAGKLRALTVTTAKGELLDRRRRAKHAG